MKNNLVKLKKKKNKKRIYLISGFGSRYINNLNNSIINKVLKINLKFSDLFMMFVLKKITLLCIKEN